MSNTLKDSLDIVDGIHVDRRGSDVAGSGIDYQFCYRTDAPALESIKETGNGRQTIRAAVPRDNRIGATPAYILSPRGVDEPRRRRERRLE